MKHCESVEILTNFEISRPQHKRIKNFVATVLAKLHLVFEAPKSFKAPSLHGKRSFLLMNRLPTSNALPNNTNHFHLILFFQS